MASLAGYLQGVMRAARAFVVGPGAVRSSDRFFGTDPATWSPTEYGDYLATSNGVYVCSRQRATRLSSLPLRLSTVDAKGGKTEVMQGDAWSLLHKVNPFWTFQRLIEMTEMSLCVWGSGYWFLERGQSGRGTPQEIWWARPDRVRVVVDPAGYVSRFLYEPVEGGELLAYEPHETIWLRYPNPLDEWAGLSPLAAARLAADSATASAKSNYILQKSGVQIAGVIGPPQGQAFSEDQAKEIETHFSKRFRGADKSHRIAVMRYEAKFQPISFTPKDAEYLGQLKWSLEEICRAYGVPLDLVGGQRTYANAKEARYAIWADTIEPEARFLAAELTEQLLPMFAGARHRVDLVEFDLSDIEVLHEAESERWKRDKERISAGAMTLNEWRLDNGLAVVAWGDVWWAPTAGGGLAPITGPRAPLALSQALSGGVVTINEQRTEQGLPPVAWGNAWWGQSSLTPISTADQAEPPEPQPPALAPGETPPEDDDVAGDEGTERGRRLARARTRAVAFGGEEHERLWRLHVRRSEPRERKVRDTVQDLFRRQEAAVLARLASERSAARSLADVAEAPFDVARWVKGFRVALRPVLGEIVAEAGRAAIEDLGLDLAFSVSDPNVKRFVERSAQRFAKQVNQTTWDLLRGELAEGVAAGEGHDALAERVKQVMGNRIRSSAETIARTETNAAATGGTLESWRQSEVVVGKRWIAALDDRTRGTHVDAHDQVVGLDEDFAVGSATGPGPGLMGEADEDVNCRCTVGAVLDTDGEE